MAEGLDYLLRFSTAIAAIDPVQLSTIIYDQMVAEGWTDLDFNAIRTASHLTYSAMVAGASLEADIA